MLLFSRWYIFALKNQHFSTEPEIKPKREGKTHHLLRSSIVLKTISSPGTKIVFTPTLVGSLLQLLLRTSSEFSSISSFFTGSFFPFALFSILSCLGLRMESIALSVSFGWLFVLFSYNGSFGWVSALFSIYSNWASENCVPSKQEYYN